jgi:hypothetical protein
MAAESDEEPQTVLQKDMGGDMLGAVLNCKDMHAIWEQTEVFIDIMEPMHGNQSVGLFSGHEHEQIQNIETRLCGVLPDTTHGNQTPMQDEPNYQNALRFIKAFHALRIIQETWILTFRKWLPTGDQWGQDFMSRLNLFHTSLKSLIKGLDKRLELNPNSNITDDDEEAILWNDATSRYIWLLIFLFDLGLTPKKQRETVKRLYCPKWVVSDPFTCSSKFRTVVLHTTEYITHLKCCAWKILRRPRYTNIPARGTRVIFEMFFISLHHQLSRIRYDLYERMTSIEVDVAVKLALEYQAKTTQQTESIPEENESSEGQEAVWNMAGISDAIPTHPTKKKESHMSELLVQLKKSS